MVHWRSPPAEPSCSAPDLAGGAMVFAVFVVMLLSFL
jgi:hypothetical protein